MTDPRYRTVDGVTIVDGLRAWDYDGERVTVVVAGTWAEPSNQFHEYWRGMFTVKTDDGRDKLMDATRLNTTVR